jgi:hypothetical protein
LSASGRYRAGRYGFDRSHIKVLNSSKIDVSGSFTISMAADSVIISPKPLMVENYGVRDTVYNGSTAATFATSPTFDSAFAGDAVTLTNGIPSFESKHAGENKSVTFSDFSLNGDDAGCYYLGNPQPTNATATIRKREVTVTGIAAVSRAYDGTVGVALNSKAQAFVAAGSATDTAGFVTGDDLSIQDDLITATVQRPYAGDSKPLTLSLTLGGADSGSYTFVQPPVKPTVDISPAIITVLAEVADKVYDGNTSATLVAGFPKMSGVMACDTFPANLIALVTAGVSYAFDDSAACSGGERKRVFRTGDYSLTSSAIGDSLLSSYAIAPPAGDSAGNDGTLTACITPAMLTVTPVSGQSKIYGQLDPTFAFTVSGWQSEADSLSAGSILTGKLSRERLSDSSVGQYAITQGSLSAGDSYSVDFTADVPFEITPADLLITPTDGQSIIYGKSESALTFTVSGWQYNDRADSISIIRGALEREDGNAGGSYLIRQGTLGVSSSYNLVFASNRVFNITPAPLTITPNAGQSKIYGENDPTFTFTVSGWRRGDEGDSAQIIRGRLSRAPGDAVSAYELTNAGASPLTAGQSYAVYVTPGVQFSVTPAPLTITPSSGQLKTIKAPDPLLTFTTDGWQYNDYRDSARILTGALSRAGSGSNDGDTVGVYAIMPGSLSAGRNYEVAFVDSVLFEITQQLMLTFELKVNDSVLLSLDHHMITDTIYYAVPCGANDTVQLLKIGYTTPLGVTDSLINVKILGGRKDGVGEVSKLGSGALSVDMEYSGRKTFTVLLHDSITSRSKPYAIVLEKQFELFDVINEHMGNVRVVRNNPSENVPGLEFKFCEWWHRREADTGWSLGESKLLYYTAGPSIYQKFTANDSMYIKLYTINGEPFETCPAGGVPSAKSSVDTTGAAADKKSAALSLYPNPVTAGGTIKLKQLELIDGEDALYAALYLFDAQGRLILKDSASALRSGLAMPETPGIYHLVLEGKAGRKVVKVAVGQRD